MLNQMSLKAETNGLNWDVQTVLTVSTTTLHVDVSDNIMVYLHSTLPIYISFTT